MLDEAVVFLDEVRERFLVGVADAGDEHAIGDFDGEADVDGFWEDNAFADEAACGGGVFREGDGEGADGVEGEPGFGIGIFPMGEEGIESAGHPDGGEGAGPGAAHGIGDGDAHGGGDGHFFVLDAVDDPILECQAQQLEFVLKMFLGEPALHQFHYLTFASQGLDYHRHKSNKLFVFSFAQGS